MNRLGIVIERVRRTMAQRRTFAAKTDWTPIAPEGARVFLVYLFDGLGDALLLAPAVAALVERGAATPIHLMLRKEAARPWKQIDLPVKIHTPTDALLTHANLDRVPKVDRAEVDALVRRLARQKFDVAVDLTARRDTNARAWVVRSNATHRLGWIADHESIATTGLTYGLPDDRDLGLRHWSRELVRPLAPLGVDAPKYDIPFVDRSAADTKARALTDGRPWILLVPGSRNPAKQWAPEGFIEIGRSLPASAPHTVVISGTPDDRKRLRQVARAIGPRARVFSGRDLATLFALVRKADAVVTNDTGPMHLAFLAQVPTIALFTWMPAVPWGPPLSDPKFVVLNVRDAEAGAQHPWARLAIHHLHTQLQRLGRLA
ncbi:MAG: glycosyltransferase family 9 protein [Deltaproteobacteria bacterium]|nr:glycosyltransferase family 9 protein [Deltaproteobacteria bacterium]